MTRRTYRGTDIEVSFDGALCLHATECVRGPPGVFDRERRPWVLADNAAVDEVSRVIARCPTGALQYLRLDGPPRRAAHGAHDGDSGQERTVGGPRSRRRPSRGRDPGAAAAGRPVPLRPFEEQTVLRQQPPRGRIPSARGQSGPGGLEHLRSGPGSSSSLDMMCGCRHEGGQEVFLDAPLDQIPIFVREHACVAGVRESLRGWLPAAPWRS
jgi:uncharacterized Fe-S cluster protein YjdI